MAKNKKTIDPNQLSLDFSAKVDYYVEAKEEIAEAVHEQPRSHQVESEFEACIEIAAAIKRALRDSAMSREQLVDAINAYFGRSAEGACDDPPTCRKPLTIHLLNHYLSKPTDYPIPVYYLYAIHHVTGSLEPAKTLVEPEGAHVATGVEVRQMQLGKLEEALAEMQRLKRELKGRKRC